MTKFEKLVKVLHENTTEDILKSLRKICSNNFSENDNEEIILKKPKHLLMQDNILKPRTFDICFLAAIYNAYPFLFDFDIKLLKYIANNLKNDYTDIMFDKIKDYIKRRNRDIEIIEKTYLDINFIKEELSKRHSLTLCLIYPEHDLKDELLTGHAITIYGIDNTFIYYHDNLPNNFLVKVFSKYLTDNNISIDNLTSPKHKEFSSINWNIPKKFSKLFVEFSLDNDSIQNFKNLNLSDLTEKLRSIFRK